MDEAAIYKSEAGRQAVMALYDSVLDRWPVPYETLTLPTRHGNTFVIAAGTTAAPPLLLLHGAGSNSMTWAGDVAVYAERYRVFAADLPGEPGKSAPNRPAWDSPAFAEWLADVLDGLQLQTATLLGLSQGGWTALKFATAYPERVEKLVLLTPGGIVPDRLSFLLKFIPLSLLGEWGGKRINRLIFAGQPVAAEVEAGMALIMRHFKPRMGTLPLFTDAELARLTMPILLLIGAKDVMRDGEKIVARMRALLPQVEAEILPGAGHALMDTTGRVLPFMVPAAGRERGVEVKKHLEPA